MGGFVLREPRDGEAILRGRQNFFTLCKKRPHRGLSLENHVGLLLKVLFFQRLGFEVNALLLLVMLFSSLRLRWVFFLAWRSICHQ